MKLKNNLESCNVWIELYIGYKFDFVCNQIKKNCHFQNNIFKCINKLNICNILDVKLQTNKTHEWAYAPPISHHRIWDFYIKRSSIFDIKTQIFKAVATFYRTNDTTNLNMYTSRRKSNTLPTRNNDLIIIFRLKFRQINFGPDLEQMDIRYISWTISKRWHISL